MAMKLVRRLDELKVEVGSRNSHTLLRGRDTCTPTPHMVLSMRSQREARSQLSLQVLVSSRCLEARLELEQATHRAARLESGQRQNTTSQHERLP